MATVAHSRALQPKTILAEELRRNVQKSGQVRGVKAAPRPGAKGAIELGDDLRSMMYGLGALVAAANGVTDPETPALQAIADFLHVSDRTREAIDKAIRQASSTTAGLVALFDAYQKARKGSEKAGSTRAHAAERAARVEQVRGLAQESALGLPMLDAGRVSKLLGSRSQNQRQYAATLRRQGAILGLPRGNRYMYPEFQFDPKTHQVYPAIEIVGKILDAGRDPWGTVSWWISPNPRLRQQQVPMELLATPDASAVLASLARAMVEPIG